MFVDEFMFIFKYIRKKLFDADSSHFFWYTDCEIPSGSTQIRKSISSLFPVDAQKRETRKEDAENE